jgi:integrase
MKLMNELFNEYMNRHSKRFKRSWKEDHYNIKKYLEPMLGNRDIASIKRADIELLHGVISSHFVANKCVALLSKMFNLAVIWEYVEKNPAANVQKHPEHSREVYFPKEEASNIFKIIARQPKPYPDIFTFLLSTGCRKSEALKLEWENVDLRLRTATFKVTKNGTDHTVPLDSNAYSAIIRQPRISKYVFINTMPRHFGERFKDLRGPWKKVIQEYDKGHYMIKDLRKTLASWMAQQNVSLYIIGGILNHKDPRATMVYSKFQVEHLRTPIQLALENIDLSGESH